MSIVFFAARALRRLPANAVNVRQDDPELDVAIETAQRSLPGFLISLNHPQPEQRGFAIKARIATPKGPEMLWVDHLGFANDSFFGKLAETPVLDPNRHRGDQVFVKIADVVDWVVYYDHGVKDGDYTDQVLRRRRQSLRFPAPILSARKGLA